VIGYLIIINGFMKHSNIQNDMKKVDVRFNTNYPVKSQYQWRVLIDGEENLVNNVRIDVPCHSTSSFIEGHGLKWHISMMANEVKIITAGVLNVVAYIK
jgi:hypothetical protein